MAYELSSTIAYGLKVRMIPVPEPSLGERLIAESMRKGLHAAHMNCSEGDPACCRKRAILVLVLVLMEGRFCLRNLNFDLCNHCETCYASIEVEVMVRIVRSHKRSIKVDFLLPCGRTVMVVVGKA